MPGWDAPLPVRRSIAAIQVVFPTSETDRICVCSCRRDNPTSCSASALQFQLIHWYVLFDHLALTSCSSERMTSISYQPDLLLAEKRFGRRSPRYQARNKDGPRNTHIASSGDPCPVRAYSVVLCSSFGHGVSMSVWVKCRKQVRQFKQTPGSDAPCSTRSNPTELIRVYPLTADARSAIRLSEAILMAAWAKPTDSTALVEHYFRPATCNTAAQSEHHHSWRPNSYTMRGSSLRQPVMRASTKHWLPPVIISPL